MAALAPLSAWACMVLAQPATTTEASAEAEIIRSAQLWIGKNRTDLARQHIEKLLRAQPQSAWAHATLGDIALREGKAAEARTQMDWLRKQAPNHPATHELTVLARLFGPDSQKLATMRLMAQAGRLQEAAALAKTLFPDGAPSSGSLALEYFQIVGNATPASDAAMGKALQQQYERTDDVRYRILTLQRQLQLGGPTPAMLQEIERLSRQPGTDELAVRGLWRWAIDKLPWSATAPAAQTYLRRYPDDVSMQQLLENAHRAVAEQRRIDNSPANVAKRAADQALSRDDLAGAQAAFERALQHAPKDAEAIGGLGIVAMRQGQHVQAQQYFTQAMAADRSAKKWPQLRDTARLWGALQRGNAALDAGDTATAAEMARQALQQQPGNAQALDLQAQVLRARGDLAGAEQAWLALRQQHTDSMAATRALVGLYIEQNRLGDAERLLEQLPASSLQDSHDLQADVLQAQADVALTQQKPAAAMDALEQAVQLTPDNAWLRHRLARLYLERGNPALANAVMDDGVQQYPAAPAMRQARALVSLTQDRAESALADLEAIAPEQRNDAQRDLLQEAKLQMYMQHAIAAQNTETRRHYLAQAQALGGASIDTVGQIANIWFNAKQPQEALAVWQHYRSLHPSTPAGDLQYAQALARADAGAQLDLLLPSLLAHRQWSSADQSTLLDLQVAAQERRIRALHAQSPTAARQLAEHTVLVQSADFEPYRLAAARARLYLAAEDSASALPLLLQALRTHPQDFDLQVDAGNASVLQGQPEQAIAHAQSAQTMAAEQAPWRQLSLVRLWQRTGNMQAAQAVLDGLAQHPEAERSDLLVHAARLQRAQRHYAQASQFFSQALAQLPDASEPQRLGIEQEQQQIEARRQAWVETGMLRLKKSGDDGMSTLNGWEVPMVAWIPRDYDGPQFVHVDRVMLNAGLLPGVAPSDMQIGSGTSATTYPANFGQTAAAASFAGDTAAQQAAADRYNRSPLRQQSANGYNIGTGHDSDAFGWDIGLTGIGMPVTNLVGGLRWSLPQTGGNDWTLRLQRRPVTGSLLSYAGAYDPLTGQTWGGVVLNSAAVAASRDTANGWALSASANLGVYTGKNVASNARAQARVGAGRDVWRTASQRIYAGVSLTGTLHQHNLAEYSWGHGGYYSPKRSLSLSLPVEWTGRQGAWAWRLQGSVSLSQTGSSTSALYPNAAAMAPAWQQTADQLRYSSTGSFGTGWSLNATIEHQVTRQLALGAHLALDRSEYYAPTNLLVYARFFFDPVRTPLVNYPRPVTPYSQF